MKSSQLVSVIITTYNRSQLVIKAIESVLNQTYENIEIIVVNDGSVDNTLEVLNEYTSNVPNIRVLNHPTSLGGNAARNTGIKSAKGTLIAGLDDDDVFLPNRISLLVENYDEKYSLVTSCSKQIIKNEVLKTKFVPIIDIGTMLYFNAIGNQALVKKEYIQKVGYYDENLKRYQDYDIWLRLIDQFGKAKMVKEVTQVINYNHTSHSNNILTNNFLGAYKFFTKHKRKMNRCQRFVNLFFIKKNQGKRINLKEAIICKVLINLQLYKVRLKYLLY